MLTKESPAYSMRTKSGDMVDTWAAGGDIYDHNMGVTSMALWEVPGYCSEELCPRWDI